MDLARPLPNGGTTRVVIASYAMPYSKDPAHTAIDLVSIHGRRARQVVADHILDAVRNHDMFTAKLWNAIGCEVDERLDAAAARRHVQLNDNEAGEPNYSPLLRNQGASVRSATTSSGGNVRD